MRDFRSFGRMVATATSLALGLFSSQAKDLIGAISLVPSAQAQTPDTPTDPHGTPYQPLEFRRLLVNTGGDAAEACLRFSQDLDPRAEAHYADYLAISPPASPALRAAGHDLCLSGLSYGTAYQVVLRHGLPAASGARTATDQTISVSLSDRSPLVAVSGAGFVLPRESVNGITIQTVNVDQLRVHVLRMSDRLLTAGIGDQLSWSSQVNLSAETVSSYELVNLLKTAATPVWSGTMQVAHDRNHTVQTAFPLAGIIRPDSPGAYLVIAENAASAQPEKLFTGGDEERDLFGTNLAAHWVVATDIALTTLSGGDGLHVLARSLASALPLPGVRLALLSEGQDVLAETVTGANGQAAFAPGLLRGKAAAAPRILAAYGAGSDFTVLDLRRPAFDFSDRGVAGRPASGLLQAFITTERGIYRPGETVNVTALLRDRLGLAVEGTPLTLVLRRPDGIEARRVTLPAGQAGGFAQGMMLSRTAARGSWTVEARVDPAGDALGRAGFDVQDFVPQQLAVKLTTPGADLAPDGQLQAALDGRFLYGAPAAGLHGEAELRVVRDLAPVPNAKGYQFGLVDETVKETVQPITVADADATGHVTINTTLDKLAATSAPLKGVLTAGLFEPSGRVVNDRIELPIRNQPLLIGIHPRDAGSNVAFGGAESAAVLDVRAFDPAGHPVAHPGLRWTVIRENRVFDWFDAGSGWTFHYHTVDEPIRDGMLDVPANVPGVVTQDLPSGQYRLVVSDPATGAASSARFGVGWTSVASADTPDKVEVTAEATALAVGQSTRLHIRGPFAGQAQVTIAGDRAFGTRLLAVPKDGAEIDVTASADWGPGAYVLVSMVRPLGGPASGRTHDPVRAVGLAWLGVNAAPHTLAVTLDAPVKVLPRQTMRIPVHVTGPTGGASPLSPAWITLSAVDEGILQLTRYVTPDPAAFLFGQRRLGLDMRDEYGRLLDGGAPAGAIREGGDEGVGGAGLPVTSTKIVSLFSGPVALDRDGNGVVTLDVPDFEGQLRLMAMAWSRDAVGRAAASVTVRDPVIADLALPRFLAPGDEAQLAVLLANTDGEAGEYHLDVAADGPVRITADHKLDWHLAAGERRQDAVRIDALDVGTAKLRADLTGPDGYRVHREWQVAVRPAHYPITLSQTAQQTPGETFRLDPRLLDGFVPGSVTVSVGYAGFAGIDTPGLLQSLYRYPFGCTEQLVSTAWPLIYLNDPGLLGRIPRDDGARPRVQRAVDTIVDREDAAGRFGLWRAGDGEASPWLDAYSLDFLMHAKEAGFDVPDEALGRAETWLGQDLRNANEYASGLFGPSEAQTRAYGSYVLARAGRGDPGLLRRLHDGLAGGTGGATPVFWDGRQDLADAAEPLELGHLAGALSLAGDHARAHDTFARAVAALGAARSGWKGPAWWFDWTYWTYVRDLAGLVALSADSGEDVLAQSLIDQFGELGLTAPHLNTQEQASLLAAAHALNRDEPGRALQVGGQQISPLHLPAEFSPDPAAVASGFVTVNSGSKGLWRTVTVEGAPRDAPPALEHGYHLRRDYLGLDGKPVDPDHLRQNDRIIVSLHGTADDDDNHRTVIVDMLPAGWEIEAPITSDTQYDFLGALSRTRVREARDDRFVAALDLGQGLTRRFEDADDSKRTLGPSEFQVAYLARVITPGRFARPEATVEDMYRPDLTARTEAGETTADPR